MSPQARARVVQSRLTLADGQLCWADGRCAGLPVKFAIDKHGYLKFCLRHGKQRLNVFAHRAIWLLHHGRWPAQEIDHINRDKFDNRIENLRDVSRIENVWNQRPPRRSPLLPEAAS